MILIPAKISVNLHKDVKRTDLLCARLKYDKMLNLLQWFLREKCVIFTLCTHTG